jgi:TonB family protein
MIATRILARLALVVGLLGAVVSCKRSASSGTSSDAMATADAVAEPASSGVGPNVPASPGERKAALAALVTGAGRADALPEAAIDPGSAFDMTLRTRLTTVEVAEPRVDVAEPRVDVQIEAAKLTTPVPNAARVVAGLRPRFRACYRIGLEADPSMAGKVVLKATIDPDGEVSGTKVASSSGVSASVAACAAAALQRVLFDAPGGKGSTLTVPLTFSQPK